MRYIINNNLQQQVICSVNKILRNILTAHNNKNYAHTFFVSFKAYNDDAEKKNFE